MGKCYSCQMRQFTYLVLSLLFLPACLLAQQETIKGTVTDAEGTSLPGVSVIVNSSDGREFATVTNANGEYQVNRSAASETLVFEYLGMKTVTESIDGRHTIHVTMTIDESTLEEVVVVGYSTQKKESLTGAISNINAEKIQTTTHSSLAQKLQGKVAGLQIRQNSGQPGDFDNSISIRGFGNPLYVIDGIAREGGNEFQRLNAEDIESISVLKDASAAIYGLRAANGVILVTTKKGGKGKTSFNYNGVVGMMRPTDVPRMASASEYAQMWNDANIFKSNGTPFYTKEELQKYIDGAPGYEGTNWYDITMKPAAVQSQHSLSASGGSEKVSYYVSFGYLNEGGLLKTDDMGYKKYNFRSNLTASLTNNLKAEILLAGRYDNKYQPGENFFNIFKGTRTTLPTESPYANDNPLYPATVLSTQNPVALSNRDLTGYLEDYTRNFQSSVQLTYTVPFVEGLSLKGMAAYDANNYQNKALSKGYNLYTFSESNGYISHPQRAGSSSISNHNSNNNSLTLQGHILYNTTLNERHHIDAVFVVEQQQWEDRWSNIRRLYGGFYTKDQIRFAETQNQESDGLENNTASLSFIGRLNYDYAGKYLVEFAFRENGSYAYSPGQRWGFFPVVSAGWRISEEDFIRNSALNFITNLKIRGSYGLVGHDLGRPFQYVPGFTIGSGGSYEFVNGSLTTGVSAPPIVNAYLSWMTAKQTNIGLDLGLWGGKLTFEGDIFERYLEGIPAARNVSVPNTFGGTLPEENLNSNKTRGFEFTISHNNRIREFQYGVSGNFSYARTMNVHVERGAFVNSWDKWRNGASDRWNDVLWGYTYDGQFQSEEELLNAPMQNGDLGNIRRELPGDFKYKDLNNDGVIDGQDESPLFYGGTPKIHFGLSLNAAWKGFDLNMLFQGSSQYTLRFNEVYAEVFAFRGNTPAYFFDRWHKADPYEANSEWIPGKWPASRSIEDVGRMYAESSVWRRDASYMRLKSLEIGYTFNPTWYSAAGIQRIRIYASGFNLFTFADPFVKPFDPEKLEGAYNAGFTYPLTKTYNFGINVSF